MGRRPARSSRRTATRRSWRRPRRVITDRGLAETRISDIAERCGVSPGLILYYFESKDRLLVEALTYANDQFYLRLPRELRRMPAARDQLDRLIELSVPGLLPEYERLDEWALWIEIWVRALRDPRWRRSARHSTAGGASRSPTSSATAGRPASSPTGVRRRRARRAVRRDDRRLGDPGAYERHGDDPERMYAICTEWANMLIGLEN